MPAIPPVHSTFDAICMHNTCHTQYSIVTVSSASVFKLSGRSHAVYNELKKFEYLCIFEIAVVICGHVGELEHIMGSATIHKSYGVPWRCKIMLITLISTAIPVRRLHTSTNRLILHCSIPHLLTKRAADVSRSHFGKDSRLSHHYAGPVQIVMLVLWWLAEFDARITYIPNPCNEPNYLARLLGWRYQFGWPELDIVLTYGYADRRQGICISRRVCPPDCFRGSIATS